MPLKKAALQRFLDCRKGTFKIKRDYYNHFIEKIGIVIILSSTTFFVFSMVKVLSP